MFIETSKEVSPNLPIIPTYIGYTHDQGAVSRPSGAERNLFIWVTDGAGYFTCNDKTKIVEKGQGFFVRKNIPHSYSKLSETFSTMWVSFLNGDGLLDHYNIENSIFFDVPHFLTESTLNLMNICENTYSKVARSAQTFMWATELLDSLFEKNLTVVEKTVRFLEQNYNKQISLDDIAKYLNINKYVLCHTYANDANESIMQTLKRIRIQKAKTLLIYSTYTVEKIGQMCGFESNCYFIKTFRGQTGQTPGNYRKLRSI